MNVEHTFRVGDHPWIESDKELPPPEEIVETIASPQSMNEGGRPEAMYMRFGKPQWYNPFNDLHHATGPTHWRKIQRTR